MMAVLITLSRDMVTNSLPWLQTADTSSGVVVDTQELSGLFHSVLQVYTMVVWTMKNSFPRSNKKGTQSGAFSFYLKNLPCSSFLLAAATSAASSEVSYRPK